MRRTYRWNGADRVEGLLRQVFLHNAGSYYLSDLVVYADGVIEVDGRTDLDGLRKLLRLGRIATSIKAGALVHTGAGSWRTDHAVPSVDGDELLCEVADAIERLNRRPDSIDRCRAAIERWLGTRSDADLRALREAYLAIPEGLRRPVLGDMDNGDRPLRVLLAEPGEMIPAPDSLPWLVEMTEADQAEAIAYFEAGNHHRGA